MKWRDFGALMLWQALVLVAVGVFQHSPGYMDADYYTVMGKQVAAGTTMEPFLWNYLDDPQGLPHPGFAYWQPLAALLAAAGIRLLGAQGTFAAARLPFFFLALLIPPMTAALAYRLSRRRLWAWMSGALAVASGFYAPYLAVPDTFTPLMVLGAAFFLLAGAPAQVFEGACRWQKPMTFRCETAWALALGTLAGLFHLARAEGFLWLLLAWAVVFARGRRQWRPYAWALLGYGLVMAPWFLRNWRVFGALTAPGSLRALWLTTYNELYDYPAAQLTFAHWWVSGWQAILRARVHALGVNLLSAVAVEGQVIWFPLALWAAWRRRGHAWVRAGLGMWLALWLGLSVAFPFASERGSFFHAASAVQPWVWALAPLGLGDALLPLARWRGWAHDHASRVLGWGLVGITVLLTVLAVQRRVVGDWPSKPVWDKELRAHWTMERALQALDVPQDAVILVNNPPGFTLNTGRPTIVIPNGDADAATAAAQRYGARYWILESAHPKAYNHFYCHPTTVPAPWRFVGKVDRYTPLFVLEATP